MDMWSCGMGMWMLHNGYVRESQEDLMGTQKRQKRAHEKPAITLLEVFCFGAVEIAIKKHISAHIGC